MARLGRTAFVGALLGLLCVWLLDTVQEVSVPPLVRIARPPATRLVVLLVDSLSDRDVGQGAMPKLAARLQHSGLHGPVQPCADAITVPCLAATISGHDRLSVFAVGANFAASGSAIEHSVLGQLQREGLRAGYFGERMLAKPMQGLTRVLADLHSDTQLLDELSRALQRDDLHVLIAHFRDLDQAAHRYGDSDPAYVDIRHRVDDQLDALIEQLLPTDHVLVMGDHGHTESGRHAAGLDTTTYAAYLGPQFSRSVSTPMRITDHAAIWARIFGFSRAAPGWLDDYYAGRAMPRQGTATTSQGVRIPAWVLVACAALACAASVKGASAFRGRSREHALGVASFGASVIVALGLGLAWPALRAFTWHSRERLVTVGVACIVASALLGLALLSWLGPPAQSDSTTWSGRYARLLSGAIVFAIPTVYWLGGPNVAQVWLAMGLFGYVLRAGITRRRKQLALSGIALLVALSLLPVKHANYVLRGFVVYTRYLPAVSNLALPIASAALLFSALAAGGLIARREHRGWLGATVGVAAAACVGFVPDLWFVVPCTLALPIVLAALRFPAAAPVGVALVLPATWFFYGGSLPILAPILGVWLLFALLPRLLRESTAALRGAVLLTLLVLSFRTGMSCRIAGIDFEFFFRFLPPDTDVTTYWLRQTLLTIFKYLIPPAFGVLLAKAGDADLTISLEASASIGRARVGMCLFFLGALLVGHPDAGATIVGDAIQEAAFWSIVLATLGIVTSACPPPTKVWKDTCATRQSVPPLDELSSPRR